MRVVRDNIIALNRELNPMKLNLIFAAVCVSLMLSGTRQVCAATAISAPEKCDTITDLVLTTLTIAYPGRTWTTATYLQMPSSITMVDNLEHAGFALFDHIAGTKRQPFSRIIGGQVASLSDIIKTVATAIDTYKRSPVAIADAVTTEKRVSALVIAIFKGFSYLGVCESDR